MIGLALVLQIGAAVPGPPPLPARQAPVVDSAIVRAAAGVPVAGAPQPTALTVKDLQHAHRIALERGDLEALVPVGKLGPMVNVHVWHADGDYVVTMNGVELRVKPGVPQLRANGDVLTLASAPQVRRGQLLLPYSAVTQLIPTLVPNLRWDAAQNRLLVFSGMASASSTAIRRATEGAATATAPARTVVNTPAPSRGDTDSPAPARARERRMVVVDAGHGGPDNGMHGPIGGGPQVYEKNITLAVAKKLGATLQDRGLDVVYTRTRDTLIALGDRGRIANKAGGDLFISIHVNAANPRWKDPGAARGFETYFLAEAKTEDSRRVERMENQSISYETAPKDQGDDLSFILSDMMQNEHLRESSELADIIQRRLRPIEPGPSRGVKQAGFMVLVTAFMPAVLVEIGFGTNPQEAAFISDPVHQQEIANAIADAALEYLDRYDRRVNTASGASGAGGSR